MTEPDALPRLDGQVALVTGASCGIDAAAARVLAADLALSRAARVEDLRGVDVEEAHQRPVDPHRVAVEDRYAPWHGPLPRRHRQRDENAGRQAKIPVSTDSHGMS